MLSRSIELKNRPSSDVKSGGHYRNFVLRFDPQEEPVLPVEGVPETCKEQGATIANCWNLFSVLFGRMLSP